MFTFLDFTIINHPVHIVEKNNKLSPSAFIPFCEFGGNMSSMGVKIDQFDIPVCNSFQAKILNDQLCYEVDLNKYKNKDNIENDLKIGLVFFMDYNEDRQIKLNKDSPDTKSVSFYESIKGSHDMEESLIYLNTIGTS